MRSTSPYRLTSVSLKSGLNRIVSDYMGKARCDTFEQVIKAERDIIPGFFCLVQTVHVQQVVEQVYHVLADNPDIIQVGVPAFLLTGIHGQLGTAADDVQRGPDIMGYGQDNVLRISSNAVFCPIVSSRRSLFLAFSRISR